jgi:aerotaxis receptor
MRNNQPVTQQEYEYPSSQMLVSATDLTGRIEYCNPAFIAVSGYSKEELIGQPHNLIRHPDMPREAFADLWTTIRSGRPWTALVKNRRKNGDHYWVQASVTPVVEKGTVVGYLSVRVKPSREAVRAADALYARIREGKSRSHKLHRGTVVRTGLAGRLQATMRLPVATRAAFGYALAPLALLLTGLAAWNGTPPLAFWIAFGVTALISVVSWQLLARHLAEPMRDMSGFATRLAAGDLTTDLVIARHDDLGEVLQALNQLKASSPMCARRSPACSTRPARSRAAMSIWRAAPSCRPPRWKRPPRPWTSSPPPCRPMPTPACGRSTWPRMPRPQRP